MPTLTLQSKYISQTMQRIHRRLQARLPQVGLLNVSAALVELCEQAAQRSRAIARPILWLRFLVAAFVLILITGLALIPFQVEWPEKGIDLISLLGAIESGINDVVFVGIAIFFLVRIESMIKRERAVRALHELRSIAHVIDMYQLTKDPDRVTDPIASRWTPTEASPPSELTAEQLGRYLDYCSEMLSIIAKIAALYGQRFSDAVVIEAVKDVESVCNLLSNKIWQKLTILNMRQSDQAVLTKPN